MESPETNPIANTWQSALRRRLVRIKRRLEKLQAQNKQLALGTADIVHSSWQTAMISLSQRDAELHQERVELSISEKELAETRRRLQQQEDSLKILQQQLQEAASRLNREQETSSESLQQQMHRLELARERNQAEREELVSAKTEANLQREQLRQQRSEIEEQFAQLREKRNELRRESEQLQESKSRLEAQVARLQRQRRRQLKLLNQRQHEQADALDTAKLELDRIQSEAADNAEADIAASQIANLQRELLLSRQQIDSLKDARRLIQDENEQLQAQIADRQSDLEAADHELRDMRAQLDSRARSDANDLLTDQLQAEIARLKTDLEQSKSRSELLTQRLAEAERDADEATRRMLEKAKAADAEESLVKDLHREIEKLRKELEQRGTQPGESSLEDLQQIDELRYQLEDARKQRQILKMQNEDLASQVAKLRMRSQGDSGKPVSLEGMSWEERKKLLLEQLAEDVDDSTEEGQKERLDMEALIERTDSEIAIRDQEIAELKQMLAQQAKSHSESTGVAVGAAAIAQMLDGDELIREEREKLRELKEQWQEKLRQAEIDVSLERAKMARERLELEEKLRELQQSTPPSSSRNEEPTTPGGRGGNKQGRWMTRLGLREGEQK